MKTRQFGSDNYAGMCPEALDALLAANKNHVPAYGEDEYTKQASAAIRDLFETDCGVFFVFNGTAANSLALASICRSYHAVIAHEFSHTFVDECNAPEFFSGGARLLLESGNNGKLSASDIEQRANERTDLHFAKTRAVTITQATEVGTVYQPDEIMAIGDVARKLGLVLHMDGARLANALGSLNCAPADATWRAGVDILSFGLTKNGLAVGEALVFFNQDIAYEFEYRCKQAGQLASKMRFLAAPWLAMLRDGTWLRHADHANRQAHALAEELRTIKGVDILFPVEANAVFVRMPRTMVDGLHGRGWHFHAYPQVNGWRLMCAWDTQDEDVQAIIGDCRELVHQT